MISSISISSFSSEPSAAPSPIWRTVTFPTSAISNSSVVPDAVQRTPPAPLLSLDALASMPSLSDIGSSPKLGSNAQPTSVTPVPHPTTPLLSAGAPPTFASQLKLNIPPVAADKPPPRPHNKISSSSPPVMWASPSLRGVKAVSESPLIAGLLSQIRSSPAPTPASASGIMLPHELDSFALSESKTASTVVSPSRSMSSAQSVPSHSALKSPLISSMRQSTAALKAALKTPTSDTVTGNITPLSIESSAHPETENPFAASFLHQSVGSVRRRDDDSRDTAKRQKSNA